MIRNERTEKSVSESMMARNETEVYEDFAEGSKVPIGGSCPGTGREKRLVAVFSAIVAMVLVLTLLAGCSSEREVYDTMENLLASQARADKEIKEELKDDSNTLEDPLVMENPYLISPLSALIIFTTEKETAIDMTINKNRHIQFEKSKAHALPVYGLYDDYENEIELTDEQGHSHTVSVKTEKYKGGVMTVEKRNKLTPDEFYLVSPDFERTSAYDGSGRLMWYLDTKDNEGAVVFLGGGRFLISDPHQGTGGIRINYSSFMEMDFLGKVRKQYIGEYGYHHEIEMINGGKEFLIPGHDEESPFMQAVVYSVDAETMKIKKKIDFYEVLHKVAPKWTEQLAKDAKFNFVINGVDYDEKTGDVIVSVRATGMLIRANMDSGKIKWIFADPAGVPKELKGYLLRPTDDTRYPYGQHACTFLPGGRIAYHNNDVDFLAEDLHLSAMKGRYSSNEIMEVDEETKTVRTLWTHDADKKILSRMSGSLEFMSDKYEKGHKLVSYGSAMKDSAYSSDKDVEVSNFDYTEGLMMELDEKDNVVWRATFPGVIHKVYRSTFYGAGGQDGAEAGTDEGEIAASNYDVVTYERISGEDVAAHSGKKVDAGKLADELDKAEKLGDSLKGNLYVYVNRAMLDYQCTSTDEIKFLFVAEYNPEKGRLFTYKKSGEELPVVNSGKYGIRVAGLKGRHLAYVQINGTWYDSGRIFDFD